jgi:hypothetical protein
VFRSRYREDTALEVHAGPFGSILLASPQTSVQRDVPLRLVEEVFGSNHSEQQCFLVLAAPQVTQFRWQRFVLIQIPHPLIVFLAHLHGSRGVGFDLVVPLTEPDCQLYQRQVTIFRSCRPVRMRSQPAFNVACLDVLGDMVAEPRT